MKVLIAEDNPVDLKILEKNIREWGYEVTLTKNGEEAWQTIKEDGLRLAILDWIMPHIDGIELCKKIRQEKASKYTYVVLLSTKERKQDMIEGLAAGADDYMIKPINFLELRARLQKGRRIIELEDNLLESQERLLNLARHDSLTTLFNRATILDILDEELEHSSRGIYPTSVIMLDIDYFKKINDSHGHHIGDIVLAYIGARLKKSFRPYDKVGRYGGDEFLVALPNCTTSNVEKIAERVCNSVAKRKIKTPSGFLSVSITLGCATSDNFSEPSVDTLIQASDKALYKAKRRGRNRVAVAKIQSLIFKRKKKP